MRVLIYKKKRTMHLLDGAKVLLHARIALGRVPRGAKTREGDGKTPEGVYIVCLVKQAGKYGRSLGLNYPNPTDAAAALVDKTIDAETYQAIVSAAVQGRRPPWGTALGGEIYIHGGGAHADWTQGCIALDDPDMEILYMHHTDIAQVEIRP